MRFSIEKMVGKLRKVHEGFHQLFFVDFSVQIVLFCFLPEWTGLHGRVVCTGTVAVIYRIYLTCQYKRSCGTEFCVR